MTIDERKNLLLKPVFNYRDVMAYCGVKKSKAFEIMKLCKEKLNGTVLFNKHAVKRNSVLEYMGTSLEQESYVLQHVDT